MYLCVIVYTEALDYVKHKKLIKLLEQINIDAKDLRIV